MDVLPASRCAVINHFFLQSGSNRQLRWRWRHPLRSAAHRKRAVRLFWRRGERWETSHDHTRTDASVRKGNLRIMSIYLLRVTRRLLNPHIIVWLIMPFITPLELMWAHIKLIVCLCYYSKLPTNSPPRKSTTESQGSEVHCTNDILVLSYIISYGWRFLLCGCVCVCALCMLLVASC